MSSDAELADLRALAMELDARIKLLERHAPPPPPPKPNGSLTARLDHAYERQKQKLQHRLVNLLSNKYLALTIGDNLGISQIDLEALPRMIAAEFTRETMVREDLEGTRRADALMGNDGRHDNTNKLMRLEVELAALKRHTDDLVSTTELPKVPDELQAKLDKPLLRQRQDQVHVAGWVKR